ncbi:hypothetical protein PBY51_021921 [Eleginops maclovinus]|uniref:Uncharacterized protein n=1 Tax=Eleginops maclovinus TaxID=56733 RepID=A0AAN7XGM2_ELEMC|nr:hypothetical protein PBY51_021921 [Eleginops maclovinus]
MQVVVNERHEGEGGEMKITTITKLQVPLVPPQRLMEAKDPPAGPQEEDEEEEVNRNKTERRLLSFFLQFDEMHTLQEHLLDVSETQLKIN